MGFLEDKNIIKISNFECNSDFTSFIENSDNIIKMVPEKFGKMEHLLLPETTGPFIKWINSNYPEIKVEIGEKDGFIELCAADYIFPLVYLASDIALPIYLGLISNYMYEILKGALRTDSSRIKLEACYEDKKSGKSKKFKYEGSPEGLNDIIKKLKFNKL